MHPLFQQILRPYMPKDAMPLHDKSEREAAFQDKVEKHYQNLLRNINSGDIGVALEEASTDIEICRRIAGALSVQPINKEVIANNILEKLHGMLRRLAEWEADDDKEKEREFHNENLADSIRAEDR